MENIEPCFCFIVVVSSHFINRPASSHHTEVHLLLRAILTLLQIDDAANQPVTRTAAFLSLIAALMSLIFGCLYIIRFGTMKNKSKAAHFLVVQ